MDFKQLEIQLLNAWYRQGIQVIYKYKSTIKWQRREGLVNIALMEDIGVNKLFQDLTDLASCERDVAVDDVKQSVQDLLESRIGVGNSVDYDPILLQRELIRYWILQDVKYIVKYKNRISEVIGNNGHEMFFDFTSGSLFPMVKDTANYPREVIWTFDEVKVSLEELLRRECVEIPVASEEPKPSVEVLLTYLDGKSETVTIAGSDGEEVLKRILDTTPKSKLNEIAMIRIV